MKNKKRPESASTLSGQNEEVNKSINSIPSIKNSLIEKIQ